MTAIAAGLLLGLSACAGSAGTAAPTEATGPVESEPITTPEATSPPAPESLAPATSTATEPDDGNGRSASVTLVLSGTTTQADGSYSASGAARFCGDAVVHLTGNLKEFSFEFPLDAAGDQIGDVTFSADDLLPGASTRLFHIGVNVTTASGHEPPALVIDTAQAGSDDTGSAQLAESSGTTTLTVDGADELGQSISMTAVCAPR